MLALQVSYGLFQDPNLLKELRLLYLELVVQRLDLLGMFDRNSLGSSFDGLCGRIDRRSEFDVFLLRMFAFGLKSSNLLGTR